MIGKLTGTLSDKNPPQVVVDCGGVGYEVHVPMSTFYNLPAAGEKVSLLTHFVVREDAQILYGFGSPGEREAFRQLIKISGVGRGASITGCGCGRIHHHFVRSGAAAGGVLLH